LNVPANTRKSEMGSAQSSVSDSCTVYSAGGRQRWY
jgi:hypothetical protein